MLEVDSNKHVILENVSILDVISYMMEQYQYPVMAATHISDINGDSQFDYFFQKYALCKEWEFLDTYQHAGSVVIKYNLHRAVLCTWKSPDGDYEVGWHIFTI